MQYIVLLSGDNAARFFNLVAVVRSGEAVSGDVLRFCIEVECSPN